MIYIEEDVLCHMAEKNDKLKTLLESFDLSIDYSKVRPFTKSTLPPITEEHERLWKQHTEK